VKTSPTRSYSIIENERFGLVFAKTVSIISGTAHTFVNKLLHKLSILMKMPIRQISLVLVVLVVFVFPWGLKHPVPEIIDTVFAKTSPKRSFSMTEYERFGLVFTETRVYQFGHR
jgi:hypothetical protein